MIILRIEGATRVMGAPPDWKDDGTCVGLPIKDWQTDEGNFMVSAWEPTPDELERIKEGKPILLGVRGTGHPVVFMSVAD